MDDHLDPFTKKQPKRVNNAIKIGVDDDDDDDDHYDYYKDIYNGYNDDDNNHDGDVSFDSTTTSPQSHPSSESRTSADVHLPSTTEWTARATVPSNSCLNEQRVGYLNAMDWPRLTINNDDPHIKETNVIDLTSSDADGGDVTTCDEMLLLAKEQRAPNNTKDSSSDEQQHQKVDDDEKSGRCAYRHFAGTPGAEEVSGTRHGAVQPKAESSSPQTNEKSQPIPPSVEVATSESLKTDSQKLVEAASSVKRKRMAPEKFVAREPVYKPKKTQHRKRSKRSPQSGIIPESTIADIGTRVYARWPENNTWYWGVITDITVSDEQPITENENASQKEGNSSSQEAFYHIRFDDGDEREFVPIQDFVTEQVFLMSERLEKSSSEEEQRKPSPAKPSSEGDKPLPEKQTKEKPTAAKNRGMRRANSKNPKSPKKAIAVGNRCYAKFTDGGWHWGTITKLNGKGIDMTCSVRYDDGDVRHDIRVLDEIMPEAAYRPEYGASSHSELDIPRCRMCVHCLKPDCGRCSACIGNKYSTSTYKECCLLRCCVKLDITVTGKPIPYFPSGWKFCFTDHGTAPRLHPALAGFCVVDLNKPLESGQARTFSCLESAGLVAGINPVNVRRAEKEIFENRLGLKIRTFEDHALVGKGYCCQWLQRPGTSALLFGTVESCARSRFDQELIFTVRYTGPSLALIIPATSCSFIPKACGVNERVAWAGCLLFEEKHGSGQSEIATALAQITCVPLKWLVPDVARHDRLTPLRVSYGSCRPKQIILFRGTKLELETKKSTIPNAGLGVFVCCTSIDGSTRDSFVLENGEMLDIGTYAPTGDNDFKDGSLFLFKNFIFEGACESWSFDAVCCEHEPGRKLFDITDDATGELHEAAILNPLSYVNETNGIEVANIRADHDPEGSVHYLLGHFQTMDGPLVLPMGKWIELKIDYGPTYEEVRVRKGYSRLPASERANLHRTIEDDDKESLQDIGSWSVKDIELCIIFLETRLPLDCYSLNSSIASRNIAKRTLLISIRLLMRLQEVREEFAALQDSRRVASSSAAAATSVGTAAAAAASPLASTVASFSATTLSAAAEVVMGEDCCDNGYSSMEEDRLIPRLRACLRQLLDSFSNGSALKNALLSENHAAFYIAKLLGCDSSTAVKRLSVVRFQTSLSQALGIPPTKPFSKHRAAAAAAARNTHLKDDDDGTNNNHHND